MKRTSSRILPLSDLATCGHLLARADRTLFLTGTPLENRVDEFKTLVGFLQPSLVESLDGST